MVLDGRRAIVDEAHAQLVRRQAPVTGHRQGFAGLEGGDESFVADPIRPLGIVPKNVDELADALD